MPKEFKPEDTRKAILAFRENYRDRYGLANPSTPSGLGQILGLAEARLQALALLLEAHPEEVIALLDKLVWQADLSENSETAARAEAGISNPVWSNLNSDKNAYIPTLTELLAADKAAPRGGASVSGEDVRADV